MIMELFPKYSVPVVVILLILGCFNFTYAKLPVISAEDFVKCSELPENQRRKILSPTEIVSTNNGKVQGYIQTVCGRDVETFYGIPYATPPTGNLRFRKPEKVENWTNILNATMKPYSCFQLNDSSFNSHRGVTMWNHDTPISEDCLYLNIFTPSRKRIISVLFWIFGGSYNSGTSTLDVYDGTILAGLFDIVVVTINYRLGPLGFAYLGTEEIPGNMGLLDQQLALSWVNENIKYFGGGESMVTIFGESAGASSVAFHLLNSKSITYFQYAILQSASATAEWAYKSPDLMLSRTKKVADCAGCKQEDLSKLAACLRKSNTNILTGCQFIDVGNVLFMNITFTPTLDYHKFLPDEPFQLLESGQFKKSNVLAGVTKNEGNYFFLYEVDPSLYEKGDYLEKANVTKAVFSKYISQILSPTQSDRCTIDLLTETFYLSYLFNYSHSQPTTLQYISVVDQITGDLQFKCPVKTLADAYSRAGIPVYIYSFEHRTKYNPWPTWMGVLHGYEIEFVFGYPLLNANYTVDEKLLSHKMMTAWTNFANTGYASASQISRIRPRESPRPRNFPDYQIFMIFRVIF